MYYLAEGQLKVEEIGKVIDAGSVIGEIGVFAPDYSHRTVVCITPCTVYEISGQRRKNSYLQSDLIRGLAAYYC